MSSNFKKPKLVAKHVVKYVSHELDAGNATRAEQVVIRLQIVEGPGAGSYKMYYGSLHDNAQQYTANALRALGMSNEDIYKPEGLGSRKAIAVERENTFPGAKNPTRIDFIDPILPPKIKVSNPVDPKKASSITSKFRSLFKATPALEPDPSVAPPEVVIPVPEADSQPAESSDAPF